MQMGKTGCDKTRSAKASWEYRFIFLAIYPVVLVFEVIERSLDILAPFSSAGRLSKSTFAAASETAHRCATHAFLG
jgi:hypothetical protein